MLCYNLKFLDLSMFSRVSDNQRISEKLASGEFANKSFKKRDGIHG